MINAFSEFGVGKAAIETRLGHNLDATSETELISLRKIYTSLRDGMSKREDWFQAAPSKPVFTAPPTPAPTLAQEDDLDYSMPPPPPAKPEPAAQPQQQPPTKTAQEYLADAIIAAGYTFDNLRDVCVKLGEKGAADWGSFDDIDGRAARKLGRSMEGLKSEMQLLVKGGVQ
jgi:hypothetical protein